MVREARKSNDNWNQRNDQNDNVPPAPQPPMIMNPGMNFGEEPRRIINNLNVSGPPNDSNGFQPGNFGNRNRESWPPTAQKGFGNNMNPFQNRPGPGPGQFMNNPRMQLDNNKMNNRNAPNNFPNRTLQNSDNMKGQFNKQGDKGPIICVKIEPVNAGYKDVRRFFQGMFIADGGIKFINDDFGKRTGMVYIKFVREQPLALSRAGQPLAGHPVTIAQISLEDFENAIDRFIPRNVMQDRNMEERFPQQNRFNDFTNDVEEPRIRPRHFKNKSTRFSEKVEDEAIKVFSCLVVEDLPTYVKEQDILKLFSAHPLISLFLSKQRGGHIAYVKFSSAEDAKKALEERTNHVVGGKAVTVKPCKDEDFEAVSKQHNPDEESVESPSIETDCLLLEQLPLKTNDRDIADFFSDIGIVPSKIHLMNNNFGFTGSAYCEFSTPKEVSIAVKKHETHLGNSVVSVTAVPRADMQAILENAIQSTVAAILPQPSRVPAPQINPGQGPKQQPVQSQLKESETIEIDSAASEEQMDVTQPFVPPNQQRVPQFMHPDQMHTRPFFNRNNFDGPPRGGFPFRGGRGGMRHRFAPPPQDDSMNDAPPGCTVYMNNVPYKAGTNEILDFFDGYAVTNNVSRRYNPNNTPSAEAKVVFESPDEAFRAVQERNAKKIWDRPIYLKQQ